MKKTNITKKIAAMLAAAMMMTTAAAITASADNGNIKLYPIECAQAGRQTYIPECVTMVVTTVHGEGIIRGVRNNSTAKYDVEACGDRCTVDLWSKKGEELIFTAQGTEGWKFVHWLNAKTGEVYSTKAKLTFRTGESAELIAVFEEDHTEEIKNKYRNYPGIEEIVKLIPPIIC